MEELVETYIGRLPARLMDDPDTLQMLIVDEIERSLPKIISELAIPQPVDSNTMQLLQYRLRTGRGFRPFTGAEKKQSIEQLKHEAFLKHLRKVRELASEDLSSNTGGEPLAQQEFFWEGTNTKPTWIRALEDWTEIRALGTARVVEWKAASFASAKSLSSVVQDQTRLEIVEDVISKAVPDIEQQHGILEIPDTPIELQEPVAQRDVRQLVALLKDGRLLTFIEPATKDLIPRGIETIQVPDREVYRMLNLEDLMSEYHNLVAGESVAHTVELRLLDALIVALENEAQWSRINKRRFHLITKKHSIGLDAVENDELNELQRLADMHADSAQPLPFPELAMLRDYAHKLGFVERP